jgi:hypothetical protein
MQDTLAQYNAQSARCRELFRKKMADYGTNWRILRPSSLTDQLLIKATRIRNIEESGVQKVADSVEGEYIGLVNYSLIALVQLSLPGDAPLELDPENALAHYDRVLAETRELMLAKNHDYGEIWREMRISSLTDMVLSKIYRIRQIEDNDGRTLASEGAAANYQDIINYSLFALIRLNEN